MIGWLKCKLFGHKRGRRIEGSTALHKALEHQVFECPRCKTTWIRKVRRATTVSA